MENQSNARASTSSSIAGWTPGTLRSLFLNSEAVLTLANVYFFDGAFFYFIGRYLHYRAYYIFYTDNDLVYITHTHNTCTFYGLIPIATSTYIQSFIQRASQSKHQDDNQSHVYSDSDSTKLPIGNYCYLLLPATNCTMNHRTRKNVTQEVQTGTPCQRQHALEMRCGARTD